MFILTYIYYQVPGDSAGGVSPCHSEQWLGAALRRGDRLESGQHQRGRETTDAGAGDTEVSDWSRGVQHETADPGGVGAVPEQCGEDRDDHDTHCQRESPPSPGQVISHLEL